MPEYGICAVNYNPGINCGLDGSGNVRACVVAGILRLPLLLGIKTNGLHAGLRGYALAVVDALRIYSQAIEKAGSQRIFNRIHIYFNNNPIYLWTLLNSKYGRKKQSS